jgi:hypothetical protein
MLPGFRFLFAAIMLSLSLLVFGLGAAALLRAAHESFASNPSWRAAPEVTFAQRPETTLPMLATLRVDTPVMESATEQAPPVASSVETSPVISAPATSEQLASVRPVDAAPVEAKTSETKTSETTSEGAAAALPAAENLLSAATPPATEATATVDQTGIAAITPPGASSGASEPAAPEPTSAVPANPAPDPARIAATKIATLGGPPVDIAEETIKAPPQARDRAAKSDQAKSDQAKPAQAKADQSAIKRRAQARRDEHRRILAARARLAAQAQQQQADPFAPHATAFTPTPAIATARH